MGWNIKVKMMTGTTHSVQLVNGAVSDCNFVHAEYNYYVHAGIYCAGTEGADPRKRSITAASSAEDKLSGSR